MSQQQNSPGSRRTAATSNGPRKTQKITQRDMDSACHRLSRVPQKFSSSKAVQSEKSEPFAVTYFKNNPDAAQDIRPPDEKLSDIETALQGQLQASEKFSLLVQQKALRFINYGENSPEAFRSFLAIGAFYNEQKRPDSAIRHLNKAKALQEQQKCEVSPDEDAQLAVELADAHLSYKTQKHTRDAFEALRPHLETEIEDIKYRHRRDLYKARCYNYLEQLDEAQEPYAAALETYDEAHQPPEGQENNEKENDQRKETQKEHAKLYCEAADAAERLNHIKTAKRYYREAMNIYSDLGIEQASKGLEIKIETLGPDEEEEEEEEQRGEENPEENPQYDEQQPSEEGHEQSNNNEEEESNKERTLSNGNEEEEKQNELSLQQKIVDKIEDNAEKENLL
ncbi:hypothetical protein TVAG_163260 [Trichomonas vaginalis G3]|uniref:TPR Domain containing protein n=1 Tax=Trichomonas vaginalis (strain ATCC PRA-98 / G3) TaxID=412133 RepID=A2DG03_TRIV3|nr:tetratricopeptide repeat domain domain-containing protein [Trichomonas vaginalis G3]EAY20630.1 hypothetical protein TVAG_163260 [Trichomonas vaginalis G3]KAI5487345.1 tetratricopeptide repeat domain domain-containing protein [Trichomonas vaginalis G3]|eukprot:XP_001581616.1 hypothetical protein [Trichomonas vaginalis G3]